MILKVLGVGNFDKNLEDAIDMDSYQIRPYKDFSDRFERIECYYFDKEFDNNGIINHNDNEKINIFNVFFDEDYVKENSNLIKSWFNNWNEPNTRYIIIENMIMGGGNLLIYYVLDLLKKYNIAPDIEYIHNGTIFYGTSSEINRITYNGYFLNPNIFLPITSIELFSLENLITLFDFYDYYGYIYKIFTRILLQAQLGYNKELLIYDKEDNNFNIRLSNIYNKNNYELLKFMMGNFKTNFLFILKKINNLSELKIIINKNIRVLSFYLLIYEDEIFFNESKISPYFKMTSRELYNITLKDTHLDNLLINSHNNILSVNSLIDLPSGSGSGSGSGSELVLSNNKLVDSIRLTELQKYYSFNISENINIKNYDVNDIINRLFNLFNINDDRLLNDFIDILKNPHIDNIILFIIILFIVLNLQKNTHKFIITVKLILLKDNQANIVKLDDFIRINEIINRIKYNPRIISNRSELIKILNEINKILFDANNKFVDQRRDLLEFYLEFNEAVNYRYSINFNFDIEKKSENELINIIYILLQTNIQINKSYQRKYLKYKNKYLNLKEYK